LHHNKNSKWLRQLVPGPGAAQFKASSRKQTFFDEQGGKVQRSSPNTVHRYNFFQEFVTL